VVEEEGGGGGGGAGAVGGCCCLTVDAELFLEKAKPKREPPEGLETTGAATGGLGWGWTGGLDSEEEGGGGGGGVRGLMESCGRGREGGGWGWVGGFVREGGGGGCIGGIGLGSGSFALVGRGVEAEADGEVGLTIVGAPLGMGSSMGAGMCAGSCFSRVA